MNRRLAILLGAAIVLGAICATPRKAPLAVFPIPRPAAASGSHAAAPSPTRPASPHRAPMPAAAHLPPLQSAIEALLALLLDGKATPADLDALRNQLLRASPAESLAAIQAFLTSGRDAVTGLGLTVGEQGALNEAPTLRVFLLDLLGQIARDAHSDIADNVSRQVLGGKTSPDEWAMALRNLAWSEPGPNAFLSGKLHEMFSYQPWLTAPSAGLLESFDFAVYSGDPSLIPTMADMAQGPIPELARAALISLDRLSEASPLAVMSYLNSNPGQLAALPYLRADYFAKADLSQPQQVSALETYLGRVDVSLDEKAKLIAELPTPASFVTSGLATTAAPNQSDARLQQVPALYQKWLSANRFPALAEPMEQVMARLAP